MRFSSSRHASTLVCTPVISSISASLKSVVMCGCLSAEPSAAGCGVSASAPSGLTRRDSFSIPRCRLLSTAGASARRRSLKLPGAFIGEPRLMGPDALAPAHDAGDEDRDEPDDENPVEGSRAADRHDRCAQAPYVAEVHQVRADQGAQASARVGERRGILARQEQRDDRGDDGRVENRDGDAQARDRLGEHVAGEGDDGDAPGRHPIEAVLHDQEQRQEDRNDRSADVDRQDGSRPGFHGRDHVGNAVERDHLELGHLLRGEPHDGQVDVAPGERGEEPGEKVPGRDAELGVGELQRPENDEERQGNQNAQQCEQKRQRERIVVDAERVHCGSGRKSDGRGAVGGPSRIIARTQRARYNAASQRRHAFAKRDMRRTAAASAIRGLLSAALTAALVLPAAVAQPYPSKPIRVILPFAGSTDAVARLLALKLSPALGQQVLPEQRLGAGGNIAHEAGAKAAPAGYTLLMAAPPLVINPHLNPKIGFDPLRDFAPVALLSAVPNVLVVHPKIAAGSLAELIDRAPELLKSAARADILHVPYKSATLALTGLLGGEIDSVIVAASSAAPYVKDGRLRAIAVLDSRRMGAMPEVPTSAEAGMPQLIAV